MSEAQVGQQLWRYHAVENLIGAGPTGKQAAKYILDNDVRIGHKRQNTGAMWWVDGNIYLPDEDFYLQSPADTVTLGLIAHEAKHLEQGLPLALSVAGELGGWQAEYNVTQELENAGFRRGRTHSPRWDRLAGLSPTSVDDLRVAQGEMLDEAGIGYLIWALPLRPEYALQSEHIFVASTYWLQYQVIEP